MCRSFFCLGLLELPSLYTLQEHPALRERPCSSNIGRHAKQIQYPHCNLNADKAQEASLAVRYMQLCRQQIAKSSICHALKLTEEKSGMSLLPGSAAVSKIKKDMLYSGINNSSA